MKFRIMGRGGYSKLLLWILAVGVVLQFLDYDWNIFNISRSFTSSRSKTNDQLTAKDTIGDGLVSSVHDGQGHAKNMKDKLDQGHSLKNPPVVTLSDVPLSTPFDLDLRLIVITYNRAKSMQRLLESLNKADFMGDKVGIDVWIDRSKDGMIHSETYITAKSFKFQRGVISVHNQTYHAGIYGQWMKTWHPAEESKEMVVFLEDDVTVSKYFYKWLKNVHAKYDSIPYINGYSLQGKSLKHGGAPGDLHAPDENVVFMYPILGTWGFSPKRENWLKYVKWYDRTSKMASFQPTVPGILPTQWYQSFIKLGKTDTMWSMWHIYYTWKYKERTVYPNLPDKAGLSINWKEAGLHYSKSQATKKGDPIVTVWDPKFDSLPDIPIHLNVNGKVCPVDQYL